MKVTAISDLHGNLIDIEPCDLLLICGDISPLDIQRDYIQMTKWIFNEFQEWIMKIDCPTIILTPGNHDFWFEKMITQSNTYLFDKLTILIDGEARIYNDVDHKWYKIYATPQCRDFGKWAYMPGNKNLSKYYSNIPYNLDILMCHDSPQVGYVGNIMEQKSEKYPNGVPAGNIYLFNEIVEKKPKICLSGHIHSGDHKSNIYGDTMYTNVSILDESYSIYFKPLTFEL